jgi:perosamine synthetase
MAGREWEYVKQCLDTNMVSSVGPFVVQFEDMLAKSCGVKHGLATVNGTAALHIAMLVAGVEPGDEVLISTLTFIAPVNAVRYIGAYPVLVDCEPLYWQMDPAKVRSFLENECVRRDGGVYNRASGRRVRAVMPVHILGHPVDMDPLLRTAQEFGLPVIEDATESLGAVYKGRKVGNLGHIACFSFNGNKLITTGGGGMIVSDNSAWMERARYLITQAKDDPLEYIHGEVGYNYRLTNVLAALGCAQMEQLNHHIAAKRRIAQVYQQALEHIPGMTPMRESPDAFSVFWMYTALVDAQEFGMDSRALLRGLAEEGIYSRPLWQTIHHSPAHAGAQAYQCVTADEIHRDAISLPCSVGLTAEQQTRVIDVIARLAGRGK